MLNIWHIFVKVKYSFVKWMIQSFGWVPKSCWLLVQNVTKANRVSQLPIFYCCNPALNLFLHPPHHLLHYIISNNYNKVGIKVLDGWIPDSPENQIHKPKSTGQLISTPWAVALSWPLSLKHLVVQSLQEWRWDGPSASQSSTLGDL